MEERQQGKSRAKYGQQVIKRLSEALTEQYGRGFSVEKSETMFSIFEKELPFTLPWSHYLQLIRIKDENERKFYEIDEKAKD